MKRALLCLLLTGCASFDVQWKEDLPGYRMQSMQWTVLPNTRAVADRCGLDVPRTACVIRIRERGQCLIYSIYTEDQADRFHAIEGGSIREHELEHCGIRKGVNVGGGWTHPGAGND